LDESLMPTSARRFSASRTAARRDPTRRFGVLAVLLALFIGGALFVATKGKVGLIWSWLVAVSLATFIAYGYDKAQAKRGGVRVPENILHALAIVGGFPGGWAGRIVFRHKTRKPVFTVILALSTVAYLGLAYVLFRVR
jgi:uncharacterized membrane protein YsdA (DUF1294 family)